MSIPPDLVQKRRTVQPKSMIPYNKETKNLFGKNANMPLAMAIPGNGIGEQVVIGGFLNFLSIYNIVITGRILLSWFPQAQGVAALQPVYAITDPYLNAFRGLIPPIFGLDLSPILAFFALNAATTATVALGHEIPEHLKKAQQKLQLKNSPLAKRMPLLVVKD